MGRFDALTSLGKKPSAEPAKALDAPQPVAQMNSESAPLPVRPNGRTPERANARRIITRNSFELYEDQMESLRKLAYAEKMDGKVGSMSAMVRDAIDKYLLDNSPLK